MNVELEKLIEYALADGYISDKDREVLFKKAQQQGFDTDELEMILEGKLYEQNKRKPQPNKCPGCGEILKGLSKVCPSCDYVLDVSSKENVETLDVSLKKLDNSLTGLSYVPSPGAGDLFKATILCILTFGLYILYKKAIKKESLFDSNRKSFDSIVLVTNNQINHLRQKYGNDRQTSDYLDNASRQILALTQKRDNACKKLGILSCVLIFMFGYVFVNFPKFPDTPEEIKAETAEEKTIRFINSDSIGKAKNAVAKIENKSTRDFYAEKIMLKEIDSFTRAKDYNAAILLTSKLSDGGYMETRKKKMDSIVALEVRELVDNKDFSRAKERAELASYSISSDLENLIELSEKIEKDIKKKRKK